MHEASCVTLEGEHEQHSLSFFGARMRERASEINTRADVAPNEFKSCRLPTSDETRYRSGIRSARLNSSRRGRFGKTKETRKFISWHFEEGLIDFTRRGSYDKN